MLRRAVDWPFLGAVLLVVITAWGAGQGNAAAPAISSSPTLPGDDAAIVLEAADGIWRSGGPYGGNVQALALSPAFASDGLALAGGWRLGRDGFMGGYGIARTTDWGATWAPVFAGSPYENVVVFDLKISLNFAHDGTAFAATDHGLLRSTDRSVTWKQLSGGLPGPGNDPTTDDMALVRLSPNYGHDKIVFGALTRSEWRPGDLYRSTDGGDTWARVISV